MATVRADHFLRHLRAAALLREGAGLTDGELLGRYVADRDESAFEAILRRHGPMVLGTCRRLLRCEQDAEDAFQATFLVLARKAASVSPPERVGNWLYGVAYQTAVRVRSAVARRCRREGPLASAAEPEVP